QIQKNEPKASTPRGSCGKQLAASVKNLPLTEFVHHADPRPACTIIFSGQWGSVIEESTATKWEATASCSKTAWPIIEIIFSAEGVPCDHKNGSSLATVWRHA